MAEKNASSLAEWLKGRCREQKLSLRLAGVKTGLSHSTIQAIINGNKPTPTSIKVLARVFSDDNHHSRMALEDKLLTLAGYRSSRENSTELSEPVAQLLDKIERFDGAQLKLMLQFADFVSEMEKK